MKLRLASALVAAVIICALAVAPAANAATYYTISRSDWAQTLASYGVAAAQPAPPDTQPTPPANQPAPPSTQPTPPTTPSTPATQPAAGTHYTISQADWANVIAAYGHTATQPTPPATQPTPPVSTGTGSGTVTGAASLSDMEQQMVSLINQERTKAGLKPLVINSQLTSLARLKSQDMADNHYFGHQSPTYGYVFDMLARYHVSNRGAGENLAQSSGVAQAMSQFMHSQTHRENILLPGWTDVGVGIVQSPSGGYLFTQIFIAK